MRASIRWFGFMVILITACSAPPTPPAQTGAALGVAPPDARPAQRKTIDVVMQGELNAFITAQGLVGNNARPSRYMHEFVNGYVTVRDGDDEVAPHLVAALPSLDAGTWKVQDDGRMEVTWKLRPGVIWHDGAPLTSDDVKFSWEVLSEPNALVGASTIARYVDRVDTPDPLTFVMSWKETQGFGGELGERQFDVLPRHILESAFRADPSSIPNHPHLTTPDVFIGSGAYRPVAWEKGSHVTVEAFDRYFLGRPKIDRVTFHFIPDSRTAMANILAGSMDASYLGVQFVEARVIEREWAMTGAGTVQFVPGAARHLIPQFRPELANPSDLLNLSVRRALAYTINRQDLVDALDLPSEMIASSTGFPTTAIGDAVERTVVKYPFDPNRAAQLLTDAGWRPGPDGVRVKDGRPFDVEYRAETQPFEGVIYPIMQQHFKNVGVNLNLYQLVGQVLQDRVEYPGLLSSAITSNNLIYAQRWHSRYIAGQQTRYSGENRQGYRNPASDMAIDRLFTAIRRDDYLRYWAESWRVITEDVGAIMTYFQLDAYIARKGLTGLQQKNRLGNAAYQVHLWDSQ